MFFRKRRSQQNASEYATAEDFREIFSRHMTGLHLLAFLLTADAHKAEEVFVAGLDDSINGNPVFRQWARSCWSQRAIIKRAIRAVKPSPAAPVEVLRHEPEKTGNPELDGLVAAVAKLRAFERFVFVLAILEGYSIPECVTLLACTPADVMKARTAALQNIALEREPQSIENLGTSQWNALFASPS